MAQVKGILGTKLGMTQIFDDTRAIPVTVIKAGPCFVAQVKTEERDGYAAVQLAFGPTRPNGLTKPMQGHFDKHGGRQLAGQEVEHLPELQQVARRRARHRHRVPRRLEPRHQVAARGTPFRP